MTNNKDIIKIYKDLYDLPELTYKEVVDFDFFRVCKNDYRFAVVCIYNERREFLLIRDFNKNIGWELAGGYVRNDEDIENGVNRIIKKECGLEVDELQPIAIINNHFEWNKRTIFHFGIAFSAMARGPLKSQQENIKIMYTHDIPEKMAYQNKEILKLAKKMIENKPFEPPYQEIEAGKKFFLCYFINKYLVKIIGNLASKKIQKKVMELILNKPQTIIDVACGDDPLILKIERKYHPRICAINDISWKTISTLRNKNKKENIISCNHNILDLPFKKIFDLIILKNTLHHIAPEEKIDLIKKLSSISKQLIIVDIEDPDRSNLLAKIWHKYYVFFLGDKGKSFLTLQEFKRLLEKNIENKKIDLGTINTIKGRYFYASLSEIKKNEEVEIKVKIKPGQVETIRKNLLKFGAAAKEKTTEKDTYFTSIYKDFIKSKICLRIREKEGSLELTYKGPTTKPMDIKKQFWKEEINIPMGSSRKEAESLLLQLGFKKVVEVTKERKKFLLENQEITLDNVENAGWFLEIETNVKNEKEREAALKENIELIKKLGLEGKNIITEPYRDIVLKNIKK